MKVARLDTLPKQDSLSIGGEPDSRYLKRQLIVVDDDYDFAGNNATDVTSVENLKLMLSWLKMDYIDFRESLISYTSSVGFSSLSNEEKIEVAKNFAVDKTDRDSVLSVNQQKSYAKEVQNNLNKVNEEKFYEDNSNAVAQDFGIPDFSSLGSSFGKERIYISSDDTSTNGSSNYSQKLRLTTDSLTGGIYRVEWYYEFTNSGNKWNYGNVSTRIQVDDAVIISDVEKKPSSSGVFESSNGFYEGAFSSGVHNIDLDFAKSGNGTASIRRARLTIWKIS